ncbi:DUF2188 domain-containing protein [Kamptonema cortianum]|nr:DUF2188 domain-containing protein [Geitlerinema splendidum]MDK3161183.1 DUF2188 domain-containing protein [Kamptonema cortianum]
MQKNTVYVTSEGKVWKVKSDRARRAAKVTKTQAEAIQIGQRIAMNRGAELIIYRLSQKCQSTDSFQSDPSQR